MAGPRQGPSEAKAAEDCKAIHHEIEGSRRRARTPGSRRPIAGRSAWRNVRDRFAHGAPTRGVASLATKDPTGRRAATWATVGERRRFETRLGVMALRRRIR